MSMWNSSLLSNKMWGKIQDQGREEKGLAVLIALISLTLFSLLGLYMNLNATTEVIISDNHESRMQAQYAARAGLNHARALIRGLEYNDLLKGADGSYDPSSYPAGQSGMYGFRNLISWSVARTLNLQDPSNEVSGLPDDGLISSGKFGSTNGTLLIPATGIAMTATNPYGAGTFTTARYFVKVTDNPEDPDSNPFVDSDQTVIVRSMGVAQTIRPATAGAARANSVVVYEARFKRDLTFLIQSPLILQGDQIESSFNGNAFQISGSANQYGIGTIDTNTSNGTPVSQVTAQLSPNQYDNVTGKGGMPSVGDITSALTGDQLDLLDPNYLGKFMGLLATFADNSYHGNQSWSGGSAPDLGTYDPSSPPNDPSQRPLVTYVDGDLSLSGNLVGAGVLAVTGNLTVSGNLRWNGIILAIGKGSISFTGATVAINGGAYASNVTCDPDGSNCRFGITKFAASGNCTIIPNDTTVHLAVTLLPSRQIAWREVISSMDP